MNFLCLKNENMRAAVVSGAYTAIITTSAYELSAMDTATVVIVVSVCMYFLK